MMSQIGAVLTKAGANVKTGGSGAAAAAACWMVVAVVTAVAATTVAVVTVQGLQRQPGAG